MKALLVVGSPRQTRSTSDALGSALLDRLEARGFEVEKRYVYRVLKSSEELNKLVRSVGESDLVIFASPVYVDSLPAPVIWLLENLSTRLDQSARPSGQSLMAISNCGYPEAQHNDPALAIYEQFARVAGFEWAGGLALGAGEPVKEQSLGEGSQSGMVRNVVAALDLVADSLTTSRVVSPSAAALMRKPLVPAPVYRLMGNLGWRIQARQNKVLSQVRQRLW